MKRICFTGHRQITDFHRITRQLLELIEKLINQGAEDFYAGGAVGFDTLCSLAVINMKHFHPQIKLHLVLPCANSEQTEGWNDEQKNIFNRILESADSVEYTSDCYTKDCMKIRNARLIELADCCVCHYTGRYISGTGQTLRMAQKKGITVYNLI
ncbi:MAG: DUF1273 domain-containing protein [Ruminococcus flavefaciens]|nr:DUF1273 domain-containing protein [Ruminococcus flavefaciens]MCM1230422.1 DUF1273 domain-containing protein [Ruminococcus flavefaciens]